METKKKIGEILVESKLVTGGNVAEALRRQMETNERLGESLLKMKCINPEQLRSALDRQRTAGDEAAAECKEAVASAFPLFRWRVPIRIKIAGLLTVVILGLILPVSFLILRRQADQATARMMTFGTALVDTYANYSAEFVLQQDWPSLDPFIREVGKLAEVRYVFILDRAGVIKAHNDVSRMEKLYAQPANGVELPPPHEGVEVLRFKEGNSHVLDFSRRIAYQNRQVGTLHLGISQASMEQDATTLRRFIIITMIVAVALGVILALGAGTLLSRPIGALVRGTQEIGRGHFDHRIKPTMNDELGDLSLAFNRMADGLRKKELIQASFGHYVTPEIVEMILSNPTDTWLKGAKKMVTVIFADIRDFTPYAEEHDPEEVVSVLNHFFTLAAEAIVSNGGRVDKFVGDQIMGVFGAPVFHERHAFQAVRAALILKEGLDAWNRERSTRESHAVCAGIGVNTGWVVAGNLGSEHHKREYTVIGDDVNLAARLQAKAGPNQIIIGAKTWEIIKDEFVIVPLDPVTVKGKKDAVPIYEVTGLVNAAQGNAVR